MNTNSEIPANNRYHQVLGALALLMLSGTVGLSLLTPESASAQENEPLLDKELAAVGDE